MPPIRPSLAVSLADPQPAPHEVALSALLFYVFVVALVRVTGKRTTAQLNNFDWLINVAVGSIGASGILRGDMRLLNAGVAIAVLAGLQWVTAWCAQRSERFERLVKAQPSLLMRDGRFLRGAMERTRVSREEILGALRAHGLARLEDVRWVILESDGSLNVVPEGDRGGDVAPVMGNVEGAETAPDPGTGAPPR